MGVTGNEKGELEIKKLNKNKQKPQTHRKQNHMCNPNSQKHMKVSEVSYIRAAGLTLFLQNMMELPFAVWIQKHFSACKYSSYHMQHDFIRGPEHNIITWQKIITGSHYKIDFHQLTLHCLFYQDRWRSVRPDITKLDFNS